MRTSLHQLEETKVLWKKGKKTIKDRGRSRQESRGTGKSEGAEIGQRICHIGRIIMAMGKKEYFRKGGKHHFLVQSREPM